MPSDWLYGDKLPRGVCHIPSQAENVAVDTVYLNDPNQKSPKSCCRQLKIDIHKEPLTCLCFLLFFGLALRIVFMRNPSLIMDSPKYAEISEQHEYNETTVSNVKFRNAPTTLPKTPGNTPRLQLDKAGPDVVKVS